MLGLGLGDWVSVKVRFGWRIREVPCLQIQGEIYTHSELLRTSGVRRGVGVNESVKKGHPGSQGELGSKGTVSGRVKAVVGWFLTALDGNRVSFCQALKIFRTPKTHSVFLSILSSGRHVA